MGASVDADVVLVVEVIVTAQAAISAFTFRFAANVDVKTVGAVSAQIADIRTGSVLVANWMDIKTDVKNVRTLRSLV
jgi:hypothetical protein